MKALITGSSGMLGSEILNELNSRGHTGTPLNRISFLKSDKKQRSLMLEGFDVIIHAAANTNVEQCELDPETCYHDNCFLTEQLFAIARQHGSKFVYISSTGVYGRNKTSPHHEYDETTPTTIHHRSKLLSEKIALSSADSLVIRTGWLFGGHIKNKKNFVANRLDEARSATSTIFANTSQIGSPTYARDCAHTIIDIISNECTGIYNVVNEGYASRFEYVKKIVELSGASIEVLPMDASGFKRSADVSENEAAVSFRMKFEGRAPLRSWQDALAEYMLNAGFLGCLRYQEVKR